MDRQTLENQHLVARYVAGQLDEAESAAFEAHYAQDADTVHDIERMLRFKEGLAVLQDRGELDALVRGRNYWRPGLGIAAGIAALAIGAWVWMGQAHTVSPIVSTIAALNEGHAQPLRVASTHMLVRTRSMSSVIRVPLPAEPSAIELRIFPSSRPANGDFRVLLGQLDAANAVAPVAETRAVASTADGFVTAWLDSAKLSRGRYAIDLVPAAGAAPEEPLDRFIIDVR